MNTTAIEWVKNPDGTQGFTSNPFTGCLNGCPYCYARRESYGRCKQADLSGYPLQKGHADDPFYPRYHPERLLDIVAHKKPAGIFLNDRSDGFADYWPRNYQEDIWETIERCPQHRFYLLTKQPQNLIKFSPFPDNCWVGVTVEGGGFATPNFITINAELGHFYKFEAKVKFISFEPLLYEPTPFALYRLTEAMLLKQINWVIIGAQTPHSEKTAPKWEWVKEIIDACDKADIPIFLKNNLGLPRYSCEGGIPFYKRVGGTMELRQEMPNATILKVIRR